MKLKILYVLFFIMLLSVVVVDFVTAQYSSGGNPCAFYATDSSWFHVENTIMLRSDVEETEVIGRFSCGVEIISETNPSITNIRIDYEMGADPKVWVKPSGKNSYGENEVCYKLYSKKDCCVGNTMAVDKKCVCVGGGEPELCAIIDVRNDEGYVSTANTKEKIEKINFCTERVDCAHCDRDDGNADPLCKTKKCKEYIKSCAPTFLYKYDGNEIYTFPRVSMHVPKRMSYGDPNYDRSIYLSGIDIASHKEYESYSDEAAGDIDYFIKSNVQFESVTHSCPLLKTSDASNNQFGGWNQVRIDPCRESACMGPGCMCEEYPYLLWSTVLSDTDPFFFMEMDDLKEYDMYTRQECGVYLQENLYETVSESKLEKFEESEVLSPYPYLCSNKEYYMLFSPYYEEYSGFFKDFSCSFRINGGTLFNTPVHKLAVLGVDGGYHAGEGYHDCGMGLRTPSEPGLYKVQVQYSGTNLELGFPGGTEEGYFYVTDNQNVCGSGNTKPSLDDLPGMCLTEEGDSVDLNDHSSDKDEDDLTYEIVSQSNGGLVSVSIKGDELIVGRPGYETGENKVCIVANDGKEDSEESCFDIFVGESESFGFDSIIYDIKGMDKELNPQSVWVSTFDDLLAEVTVCVDPDSSPEFEYDINIDGVSYENRITTGEVGEKSLGRSDGEGWGWLTSEIETRDSSRANVECEVESGKLSCKIPISNKDTERGEKIKLSAKVYVDDEEVYSSSFDELTVADHNLIFIPMDVSREELSNAASAQFITYWDLAGDDLKLNRIIRNKPKNTKSDSAMRNHVKSLVEKINPKLDRIVGVFKNVRDGSVGWTTSDDIVFVIKSDNLALAHEVGHTYGLCDEYIYSLYEEESGYMNCRNEYPDCCKDNPDYLEGNNCIPENYNRKQCAGNLIKDINSIMGNIDETEPFYKGVFFPVKVPN